MEEQIMMLLQQLPNLAVAIAALWWGAQIINKMLEHQRQLIDRLLEMATKNEKLAMQVTPREQA